MPSSREEMVKLINRSYNRMLSFSTDGTFSARVSQDQFLVTPKGLDRMNLRNDELVLIQDNYREMGKIPEPRGQDSSKRSTTHIPGSMQSSFPNPST